MPQGYLIILGPGFNSKSPARIRTKLNQCVFRILFLGKLDESLGENIFNFDFRLFRELQFTGPLEDRRPKWESFMKLKLWGVSKSLLMALELQTALEIW